MFTTYIYYVFNLHFGKKKNVGDLTMFIIFNWINVIDFTVNRFMQIWMINAFWKCNYLNKIKQMEIVGKLWHVAFFIAEILSLSLIWQ